MIVKNEEQTLERCLASSRSVADEIIVVDTGSADRTKEVASKYTDRIYDFTWCDDFSAARNFSYEKATMDYILWLDADDILLVDDILKIRNLKSTLPADVDAVMMRYHTGFDQQGNVTFSYYRERLTRRSKGFRWQEPVHEYLQTAGKIVPSDAAVTHAKPVSAELEKPSDRNIRIYENMLNQKMELSPRGLYYYARELEDHGRFADSLKQFEKFLNSGDGWVEDCISACREMARCHLALSEPDQALLAMLRSFTYDIPRAETCCQIGYYFMDKNDYGKAIFWFETALNLRPPEQSWGFSQPDCRGYIPCLECTVCYDKLGDRDKAEAYNERAAVFKPGSEKVAFNRRYFQALRKVELLKEQEVPGHVPTELPS